MTRNFYIAVILIIIAISLVGVFFSSIIKDTREPVNFCNQTISEANNPINWHGGVYSPEGCDLSKYKITR